jgi:hypothetical protein
VWKLLAAAMGGLDVHCRMDAMDAACRRLHYRIDTVDVDPDTMLKSATAAWLGFTDFAPDPSS